MPPVEDSIISWSQWEETYKPINQDMLDFSSEAQELAGAVVWLAAEKASSFVTGQNIVVDGGFSSTTI